MIPLLCILSLASYLALQAPPPPEIPLRHGLTVVTALSDTRGDYESVKQVMAIDDSTVTVAYAGDVPGRGTVTATRPIRRADLRTAEEYRNQFQSEDTRAYPGTTALGPSVAVLSALARGQDGELRVPGAYRDGDAPHAGHAVDGRGVRRVAAERVHTLLGRARNRRSSW
jgi:hypothetical protein